MISHISIKNFATIENIDVDFEDGLNIITGETGSGKSIVIEAISLALGSRADSSYVRTGTDKAVIQLVGYLGDDEFVITREISATGKNLCRLNGEIVTLGRISQIASKLADIHGQYDNQSLLDPEYHIVMLDSYRHEETDSLREEVSRYYDEFSRCRRVLASLLSGEKESKRKLEFYRFEADEIDKADLMPGEDSELADRISLLQNSEKIYENLGSAYDAMYEESPSVMDGLGSAVKAVEEISFCSKDMASLSEEFTDLYYRLEDICRQLRSMKDSVTFSPADLDMAILRQETIENLKKKYGGTIDDVLRYREELRARLDEAENSDEKKTVLMKELKSLRSSLLESCARLTEARTIKAAQLEQAIQKELIDLNFPDSKVAVQVSSLDEPSANGADQIRFLMSTNKGEPLKPLDKIVSGGEMSRIMLAFKNIVSSYDQIPTLIFDEIDTGISGITASIVGNKLREISRSHQVICITHLPQIAAAGDHNFRIHKESDDSSTYTFVDPLTADETVMEIARLLGGAVITDSTIQSARELISRR